MTNSRARSLSQAPYEQDLYKYGSSDKIASHYSPRASHLSLGTVTSVRSHPVPPQFTRAPGTVEELNVDLMVTGDQTRSSTNLHVPVSEKPVVVTQAICRWDSCSRRTVACFPRAIKLQTYPGHVPVIAERFFFIVVPDIAERLCVLSVGAYSRSDG